MPTLSEYCREAIIRAGPDVLGRIAAISSLTTTTVVSSALAYGGTSEQRYAQKWVWRPDTTTTADKTRYADSFAPATGTLTHSGTNYSDTTATGEDVFITNFEPYLFREACDVVVRQLRRLDRTEIPRRPGQARFFLNYPWIKEPNDIAMVCASQSPVISLDRYFDKWGTVNTSGALQPTHWTLSGSGATVARSTDHYWRGAHVVALTRSGTNCDITQTIPVHRVGVDGYDLRGKQVTMVSAVWCDTASRAYIFLSDGVTSNVETHSGGSTWEVLSDSITISNDAESLSILCGVTTGDATGYFGEAFLVETDKLSDAVRHDNYLEREVPHRFLQVGTLQVLSPEDSSGQLAIYSKRPYPGFDPDRLVSGAADADSSDAPLEAVACGIIARLFAGRAASANAQPGDGALAGHWQAKYEQLAAKHLTLPRKDYTDRILNGPLAPRAARIR